MSKVVTFPSEFPRTTQIGGLTIDLVLPDALHRYGNTSKVRLEVRYGNDDSVYELVGVHVDYLKTPQYIRITQEQLDKTEDTSQIMEYPDYICQEIINELVHIIMENATDLRVLTHIPISQSIANPAQAAAQSGSAAS